MSGLWLLFITSSWWPECKGHGACRALPSGPGLRRHDRGSLPGFMMAPFPLVGALVLAVRGGERGPGGSDDCSVTFRSLKFKFSESGGM